MTQLLTRAAKRARAVITAPLTDIEDELRHMGEVNQRWAVAFGVLAVALIGISLAFN